MLNPGAELSFHCIAITPYSTAAAASHTCFCVGGLASLFGTLWDYLENLYISNCAPVMRADDLVHLTCFSKLVRLNIDSLRGPVEARQINHLGRLTNLQELRILFAGHGLEQNLLVCLPYHMAFLLLNVLVDYSCCSLRGLNRSSTTCYVK